jgi:hypothetical protein
MMFSSFSLLFLFLMLLLCADGQLDGVNCGNGGRAAMGFVINGSGC